MAGKSPPTADRPTLEIISMIRMHETSNANYLSPVFPLIDTIYRMFRIKVANNRAKQTYTACPRVRPIRLWRVAACWLANGVGFTSGSLYFSYQTTATFSQRQNLISYSRNERQLRDVEKISALVRDILYAKSLVYRVIRQISYWSSLKVSYCL